MITKLKKIDQLIEHIAINYEVNHRYFKFKRSDFTKNFKLFLRYNCLHFYI